MNVTRLPLSTLLIVSLLVQPFALPQGALAADKDAKSEDDRKKAICDNACDDYLRIASSENALIQHCGGMSAAGTNSSDFERCKSTTAARYRDIGPLCSAYALSDQAADYQLKTAIAYTAAAAVCGGACAATVMSLGAAAPVSAYACKVAGAGAAIMQLSCVKELKVDGGEFGNFWNSGSIKVTTLAGYAGSAVAIAPWQLVAGPTGMNPACLAAGIFVATAALSWGGLAANNGNVKETCDKITQLPGWGAYDPAFADGSQNGPGRFGSGSPGAAGGRTSMAASNSRKGNKDLNQLSSFPGELTMGATDGMNDLFNEMPNRNAIPDAFKKLSGMDLNELGSRLSSGQSPSQVMSGINGLSGEVKALAEGIEGLAKQGRLANNASGAVYAGGGGGGKGGGGNGLGNLFDFGARAPAESAVGASEVKFNQQKKADLALGGDDIWHSNWNGTIFQLVSKKLDTARDRVEQLEWQSPLNRALAGLPAVKGEASQQLPPGRQ